MTYRNLPITNRKLGARYTKEHTTFRVWSPLREEIGLAIYDNQNSFARVLHRMVKDEEGVHEKIINGDLKGKFYTLIIGDKEITDPYSISSSINSIRSAIIDLKDTNPLGWDSYERPKTNNHAPIIYELHIKDFTGHKTSGVKHRGKYLGLVEHKPLNHLKDLGVTHIHLMPVFDFLTVREDKDLFFEDNNYNWGYDPELYNVVEGSYATKPEDPINRIKEFKTMVMELHKAGFKVIMDVVYNHTYRTKDSNFNIIMPFYYYRQNSRGEFSNGSGCGNELATERFMVRRFIIDSLKYWTREFHIDGFRFDLMALIDINTVNTLIDELRLINPDILIYGEPWTADESPLDAKERTLKGSQQDKNFALFNDDFRDAIKGDNDGYGRGFIQGNIDCKIAVETGLVGSIYYDNEHIGFTSNSYQSINYINSHDNLILRDKINKSFPGLNIESKTRLNKLAFAILFTSQGIPFIHAGNEFLRTKYMEHNTYNLPLTINEIDWKLKEEHYEFFNYFKDLIKLRKNYKEFNLYKADDIRIKIKFMKFQPDAPIIAFSISMENKEYLLVVHNGGYSDYIITKTHILDHIRENYIDRREKLSIRPIFNEEGLVSEDKEIVYQGIEVPFLSTVVYKLE